MGRADRRRKERQDRIETRNGKFLLAKDDIRQMEQNIIDDITKQDVAILMTSFALALKRIDNFDAEECNVHLQYVDQLFADFLNGKATLDDYRNELAEIGLEIKE